jgi:hypothetical protein
MLIRLLTKRFGKLKTAMCKKIGQLSIEELEQLADDFLGLNTVDNLAQWLSGKTRQEYFGTCFLKRRTSEGEPQMLHSLISPSRLSLLFPSQ